MRILIVEDDPSIARSIQKGLVAAGYTAETVGSAEDARTALNTDAFDLGIVDIGLPCADGLSLIRHLRKQRNPLPVLILTARDALSDRVTALDLGADDYMIKPFELEELTARCRALIRRVRRVDTNEIRIGSLSVDLAARKVDVGGRDIPLTRNEWALLEHLVLNAGRMVDKEHLRVTLEKAERESTLHAVESCISRLRAKLGPPVSIAALRGFGYRLDDPSA